jgi:hypothetical protein
LRVYTAHIDPVSAAEDRGAVFLCEGFSWAGGLFTFIWALWHGMWLTAIGLLAAGLAVGGIAAGLGLDALGAGALQFGYALIVGFSANDLRRRSLVRRGYVFAGVVAAPGLTAAEQRFFGRKAVWAP